VFLPNLVQGELGYSATIAGLTIVPRGVLMMLVVLAVGQVIGKIDVRIVLAVGSVLMAVGLALLTAIQSADDLGWIVLGSTVQAMGAGMILMPLSTYAFSTLPIEMRTDAAGLYSLLRQLGCASGLALVSGVLQLKISTHLLDAASGALQPARPVDGATLQAYADCFGMMSIAAVVVMPGILLFRTGRAEKAATGIV
jgi:DHA2 family multidrug resistance protein